MAPASKDEIFEIFMRIQRRFIHEIQRNDVQAHRQQIPMQVKNFGMLTNESNTKVVPKGLTREDANNLVQNKGECTSLMKIDSMIADTFAGFCESDSYQQGLKRKRLHFENKTCTSASITKTSQDFINLYGDKSDILDDSPDRGYSEMDLEPTIIEKDPKTLVDISSFTTRAPEQHSFLDSKKNIFEEFKSHVLPSYQELCHKMKKKEMTNNTVDHSNLVHTADDLEPMPFMLEKHPNHFVMSDNEYLEALQKLEHRAKASWRSQKLIIDYDRKMGLKKSHSKTMRETRRSRKQMMNFIREEATRFDETME